MKILSAEEVRLWDQYTIEHEPIASIDLMERASTRCTEWLITNYPDAESFSIFCGKGNNGGDGLAVARMLMQRKYDVTVYILEFGHKGTADFQTNLALLHKLPHHDIHFIQSTGNFHELPKGQIVVDAIFGSGLNRLLEGVTASLVDHINNAGCEIVSIDIPSGLFVDRSSKNNPAIQASHTLSFECYKPAFLFAENAAAVGEIHILHIGLHPGFYHTLNNRLEMVDVGLIRSIHKPRKRFAHKGDFGHALLIAGSYGKMGAAVLCTKACLRSGAGLVSCHIPASGYNIMQTSVPEAMVMTDRNDRLLSLIDTSENHDLTKYDAIGTGPGIGTATETKMMLRDLFDHYRSPMVIDADALNIMASQKDLLRLVPAGSLLTPHPKEFERLFGSSDNDFDRAMLALQKAKELSCIIILKGHHTLIATPDGKGFFNTTGNPGMSTGGTGDVLTGILIGLLAQGYSSIEAAILGVYVHGLAGDLAAKQLGEEALIAGDVIENMGAAYQAISPSSFNIA